MDNVIVYVLIMIFSGSTHHSGVTAMNQEFSSWETCEAARIYTLNSVTKFNVDVKVRSQGCFKK